MQPLRVIEEEAYALMANDYINDQILFYVVIKYYWMLSAILYSEFCIY